MLHWDAVSNATEILLVSWLLRKTLTEAQEAHEEQDQDPVQQVSRVTQREQVPRHSVIILVFIQQTLVLASLRHVHGSRSCDSARVAASHVISSSMSEKNRRGGKIISKRKKQPTGYRTSLTIIFKTYFKNKVWEFWNEFIFRMTTSKLKKIHLHKKLFKL